jgi:hypothetical protein
MKIFGVPPVRLDDKEDKEIFHEDRYIRIKEMAKFSSIDSDEVLNDLKNIINTFSHPSLDEFKLHKAELLRV